MNNVHFSSITDEWRTPESFYSKLHEEFNFNFDPCPIGGLLNGLIDGLNCEWGARTFCNPPYSQIAKWVKKAYEESQKGKTVVLLIPSRTDTRWWHDYCMKGEIRFIKGRLKFGDAKNSAPFPSAVVIFTPTKEEVAALADAAKMTIARAKEKTEAVIDAAHRRQIRGAMVYCSSEVIHE